MGKSNEINDRERACLAVIGAGCWGTTLAAVQSANFRRVNIFTPEPDSCEEITRYQSNEKYLEGFRLPRNIFATASLERALDGARLALVVVPSHAVRTIARDMKEACGDRVPVVIATKGLEKNTGLLSIEAWRQEWGGARRGGRDPMVLSGPNLAREVCAGMPTVSLLAGRDAEQARRAVSLLDHPLLALVPYHDPLGAQAAGALKNVYAVGCGMAAALGWGDNAMGTLIWRGLQETSRFAAAVGGDPAVVSTPAGVGDFIATCTSPLSRNHDLGRILAGLGGDREGVKGVREGAQTAQEAVRRSRSLGLELRLLTSIWSVMAGGESPMAMLEEACRAGGERRPEAARRVSPAPGFAAEMGVAAE